MKGEIYGIQDAEQFVREFAEFTNHSTMQIASGLILANLEDHNYNRLVEQLDRERFAGWTWYKAEYPFINAYGQDLAQAVLDIAEEFLNSWQFLMLSEGLVDNGF